MDAISTLEEDAIDVVFPPAVPPADDLIVLDIPEFSQIVIDPAWPNTYDTGFYHVDTLEYKGLVKLTTRASQDGDQYTVDEITDKFIRVKSVVRDLLNNDHNIVFSVLSDDKSTVNDFIMPASEVNGADNKSLQGKLNKQGILFAPNSITLFLEYIYRRQKTLKPESFSSKAGWIGGSFFVGNLEIKPESTKKSQIKSNVYESAGSLSDWTEKIGSKIAGNPMLFTSIVVGLSGVISGFLNLDRCVGVHFMGESRTGKTTIAEVAAGLWGKPSSYKLSWDASASGLETKLEARNHTCLILDELSRVTDFSKVPGMVFLWSNGSGKARTNAALEDKRSKEWSIPLVSTGEYSISSPDDKATGHENRLICIPASNRSFGVFDNLHGMEHGTAFSDYIKRVTSIYYGTAGPAFAQYIADKYAKDEIINESIDNLRGRINAFEKVFQEMNGGKDNLDGSVMSVITNISVLMLTAELAIESGLFKLTGTYEQSVPLVYLDSVLKSWLSTRGSPSDPGEYKKLKKRILSLIKESRNFDEIAHDGPFVKTSPHNGKVYAGVREIVMDNDEDSKAGKCSEKDFKSETYYITHQTWENEILKGYLLSKDDTDRLIRDGFWKDVTYEKSQQKQFRQLFLKNKKYMRLHDPD